MNTATENPNLTTGGRMRRLIDQSDGLFQSLVVLALLVAVITMITPRFLSRINLTNLMAQMAPMLIVASGMTIVMISGEFDLSVGSVVALTASVSAVLIKQYGIFPGFLLSMLVGPALGVFNATVILKGRVPSFIATLGMLMMARSLAFVVTDGQVIANIPESFKVIGQGFVLGIPLPFLIALSCYLIGFILLTRTAFGKKVYAVGANRRVAILSGIRADRVKFATLLIVGLTASFAGNILLARIGAIQADTARGLEFEVIAAVVIGGTSLHGGQGNILRTIIGVVIIAMIRNFLNLSQINIFWQDFATGAIIIGAVLFDLLQKRWSASRAT
jgi:ribose/xylose/arabinose/galactoside ABC-type transport system permease subunit